MKMATKLNQDALLDSAERLYQQQQWLEAEKLCDQIIATNPSNSLALHLKGIIAFSQNHHDRAEILLEQSLRLQPNDLSNLINLSNVYQKRQRFEQAQTCLEHALKLNNKIPEIWYNLGCLFSDQEMHEEAIAHFKEAVARRPGWLKPLSRLGIELKLVGNLIEAEHALSEALSLSMKNPDRSDLLQLGTILQHLDRYDEAWDIFKQALLKNPTADLYNTMAWSASIREGWNVGITYLSKATELRPNDPNLYLNLAKAYKELGKLRDAEQACIAAIKISPRFFKAHYDLGNLYKEIGNMQEAEACYRIAADIDPNSADVWLNWGFLYDAGNHLDKALEFYLHGLKGLQNKRNPTAEANLLVNIYCIYMKQGNWKAARQFIARIQETKKNNYQAFSNYLFWMHYNPEVTKEEIFNESKKYGQLFAEPVKQLSHRNERDPLKRLRIGYVSGDFFNHAVSNYIRPVFPAHNKQNVEIFCYSNHWKEDEVTKELQASADHWKNIMLLSDDAAAKLIQSDQIDILIDLSGHTGRNRLNLFARKPAPIQATWIGYFNTTGVSAIGYIITDRFLLPPENEPFYVEKPLRLPYSGAVYSAPNVSIGVSELPALRNGYVTLGCFNNLSKIAPEVLNLWAKILLQLPQAKLYLKNAAFGDAKVCALYYERFADIGIGAERLIFAGASKKEEYLAEYHQVDLGLDPFPYNGATTTLDSLWMGVPIIALKGDSLVSNIGESLLHAVELPELVAATKDEYIAKAVAYANNLPRLAEIRRNLRSTLTAAPITNPTLFTHGLEAAFRGVWAQWCTNQQSQ